MKRIKNLSVAAALAIGASAFAQTPIDVDASKSIAEIQPTMYGIFFEDINFAADGGLYAELIKNRSFEFESPKMGWKEPNSNRHSLNKNSGIAKIINYTDNTGNKNYARFEINDASGYEIINEGFRGMGVKADENYRISVMTGKVNGISAIKFELLDENEDVFGEASIAPKGNNWTTSEVTITPSKTVEKATLRITFSGKGSIDMDMISMFPEETWKGRKNGLRKDLVQLLADIQPGFLRFPGGCIVEGRTLEKRYQWKKTVGAIEDREMLVNRWNTEFSNKLTPDYYQSFGLGFFEYFQLSEDLEAEPLPILSCGIACQYNTGELAPMDGLDPYVQDALDLIEFANGDTSSKWGKVRANMGHPEPFNLKFIGVGNEQWGQEYIERYEVFAKAIKEKYPEIIIVSGSGPSPDGEYFDYGWEQLKKLDAQLVDEHYYKSPEWFKANADRYDDYDRNGPKVFAGEYAAHPKAEDGPKENNLEAAVAEAAFMTGLERNADVVHLTSYAPLMAHKDAWQWAPDLIWFDNLSSHGTVNYYVQKLFANNKGTNVLKVRSNGDKIIGHEDIYATAAIDADKKEIILKLVNTSAENKEVILNISGSTFKKKADWICLSGDNIKAYNSFEEPNTIVPVEKEVKIKNNNTIELAPNSVNIIKLKKS
ncbi:alpha-L-arabinofuranosidase C-terminal domain-containing protein [Zunongwangia pacifica]|uniref:non-reducing end alpha-L-arabinofuranosidase n=1 Tax=Zunongwangia pacifica TaxID=2911062 RepID=A0A9X1ZSP7_9FLAO|nr:alpha-L-arabinofuranosidase C-terminal domain-containing protein [Zunongwangia pacifica]MCL6219411.1 alpha-L-arabinofuranosidase [Zunongwangia pacifica]